MCSATPLSLQDDVRTQTATKQKSTLEAVNNSVKLLNEMLAYFSPEESTDSDKDLIRVCSLLNKDSWTWREDMGQVSLKHTKAECRD